MKNLLALMAHNKHTSAAAILGFLTQALPIFFPEYKAKCDELFKLCIIYGFARAGDATLPPGQSKSGSRLPLALLIGCIGLMFASGCASVRQTATTTTTGTNGVVTVTQAESKIYVIGDAKNTVEKARASAGKTLSVGTSGVSEESTSAGLDALLRTIFEAGRASVKP